MECILDIHHNSLMVHINGNFNVCIGVLFMHNGLQRILLNFYQIIQCYTSCESHKYFVKIIKLTNSLWPSYAMWQHKSVSTMAQTMACCLKTPTHYLNQCWLLINEVLWPSFESNFSVNAHVTILYNEFENGWERELWNAVCDSAAIFASWHQVPESPYFLENPLILKGVLKYLKCS